MDEIPEKLQQTLENLEMFPDRASRIELLIGIAEKFRPVPESIAARPYSEEHRVKGCESEAFVFALPRDDGSLDFHFAVENPQGLSAMALASILKDSLSGAPLKQVLNIPHEVVLRIFGRELSMGKNMGLTNMLAMVQEEARRRLQG